jgi:hypothetical protein
MKKDGETTKDVPLIGLGFNNFIIHLFWFLPSASIKQDYAVLNEIAGATNGDLEIKLRCSNLTMTQTQYFFTCGTCSECILAVPQDIIIPLSRRRNRRRKWPTRRKTQRSSRRGGTGLYGRRRHSCSWRRCLSQTMDESKTNQTLQFVPIGC